MSSFSDLLPQRVRERALTQPSIEIVAFLDEECEIQDSWTYAELDENARSLAAHLQARKLEGKPVILAFQPGLDFASAFLGCMYANAIAVPTSLPRAHGKDKRLTGILADCGATQILTSSRLLSSLGRHAPSGVALLAVDTLPNQSRVWAEPTWSAEALALLQYTSGSTSAPRGVMVTHGNVAANLRSLHEAFGTDEQSVGISWLPLFHDMGLIAGLLEALWVGYRSYLMAPSAFVQQPLRWLEAFSRYRGTIGGGPNFAFQACAESALKSDITHLDLSTWKVAWNGAEPVRANTLELFAKTFESNGFDPVSLTPSYGLAEATLGVSASKVSSIATELVVDESDLRNDVIRETDISAPTSKRLVGCGLPANGTEIRIVNPDTLSACQAKRVGEIWVRSESVAKGYWRDDEASGETFRAHLSSGEGPYLRTGDLGFLADGELFVTGRLKDVIVIRGVNYYPQDIETTVGESHAALRADAGAVFSIENEGRPHLVVVQEVRRDQRRSLNSPEVVETIRRAVAREHQLRVDQVVLLKPFSLPRTSSGKVQRSQCRSDLAEGSLASIHSWFAPTATLAVLDLSGESLVQPGVLERQLVEWLQKELALNTLTWQTPLMELGVDSLKGVELVNSLSTTFNHSFPVTLILEYPNIEALARYIRTEVLGSKEQPATESAERRQGSKDSDLSERIAALDDAALDALLRESIEEILNSGGRP